MNYEYQCRVRAVDFWLLSMYHTYHSLVGVCNIVFAVAMIVLTLRFWNQAGDALQALLLLLCLIIPVIQPACVYLKAKTQAAVAPQGTRLCFTDQGVDVTLDDKRELIRWNQVRGVLKEPNMVIVMTGARTGYMLTNRVLGKDREMFYNDVKAHINVDGKGA